MPASTDTTEAVPGPGPVTGPLPSRPSGRAWAYTGTVLGAITSVAANIADAYVPPPNSPATHSWTPETGAVLGALFWPLALLVSSEVLARKHWAGPWARATGIASVLLVGAVAAVISYQHLHDLLLHYQETPLAAAIGPLAVDGLMIVSSLALVANDAPATVIPTSTGTAVVDLADATGPRPLDAVPPRNRPNGSVGNAVDPIPSHWSTASSSTNGATTEPAESGESVPGTRTGNGSTSAGSAPADPAPADPAPAGSAPSGADPIPGPGRSVSKANGSHRPRARSASVHNGPDRHAPTDTPPQVRPARSGRRDVVARPADVARIREAIAAGDLPPAPTADAIRVFLGISPAYARATRNVVAQDIHSAPTATPPETLPPPNGSPNATRPEHHPHQLPSAAEPH